MQSSNIDDILLGLQSAPPVDTSADDQSIESSDESEVEEATDEETEESSPYSDDENNTESDESAEEIEPDEEKPISKKEYDDYGNEKEILSKSMQKRLERQAENLKRKYESENAELRAKLAQLTPQQVKQVEQNFVQDPNADGSWQEQLSMFVEQTVQNIDKKRVKENRESQEKQIQQEFESKLIRGMERFEDFRETIRNLPCEISDPMTAATRSLDDPAAFLYAAAKQYPQELERISKIVDPYGQIREIGKLEERMRKHKATTNAPRPIARVRDDAKVPVSKKQKEETIEELMAKSDAKRLAQMRGKGRR